MSNTSAALKIETQMAELRQAVRDMLAENIELRQRIIDLKDKNEWLEEQLEAAR